MLFFIVESTHLEFSNLKSISIFCEQYFSERHINLEMAKTATFCELEFLISLVSSYIWVSMGTILSITRGWYWSKKLPNTVSNIQMVWYHFLLSPEVFDYCNQTPPQNHLESYWAHCQLNSRTCYSQTFSQPHSLDILVVPRCHIYG